MAKNEPEDNLHCFDNDSTPSDEAVKKTKMKCYMKRCSKPERNTFFMDYPSSS